MARAQQRLVHSWKAVAFVGFALMALNLGTGLGGRALDSFVNKWLDDSLELLAATGCFLRAALVTRERAAWSVLGFAIMSFAVGDLCFDFVYDGKAPTPSVGDLFYLLFYPGCYTALLLLVRSRISTFNRSVWLDGLIAALASAAIGASVIFQLVLQDTKSPADRRRRSRLPPR